jgi:hypothetical protein
MTWFLTLARSRPADSESFQTLVVLGEKFGVISFHLLLFSLMSIQRNDCEFQILQFLSFSIRTKEFLVRFVYFYKIFIYYFFQGDCIPLSNWMVDGGDKGHLYMCKIFFVIFALCDLIYFYEWVVEVDE